MQKGCSSVKQKCILENTKKCLKIGSSFDTVTTEFEWMQPNFDFYSDKVRQNFPSCLKKMFFSLLPCVCKASVIDAPFLLGQYLTKFFFQLEQMSNCNYSYIFFKAEIQCIVFLKFASSQKFCPKHNFQNFLFLVVKNLYHLSVSKELTLQW